jgi:hypothetical protein
MTGLRDRQGFEDLRDKWQAGTAAHAIDVRQW